MKKSPCETCPHRQPMDREHWRKIAEAQREATPQLSRKANAKLTTIERKMFEGVEREVPNCEGYSTPKALAGALFGRMFTALRIKRSEAGGTRLVPWHESACNNPFLESPEYFELQDEFLGQDPKPSKMFVSKRQESAFIEDTVATQRMMGGGALAAGGVFLESATSAVPLEVAGAGAFGLGAYFAATGAYNLVQALRVQLQEKRAHDPAQQ
jgi:hypothetical protein